MNRERAMPLRPQTPPWFDRLATLQQGYSYPWRSRIGAGNGEDAYLRLVNEHLSPDMDVLDVACGHGEVALDLAPRCRSMFGYDRTAPWIELARKAADERGIENAAFVCHDSSLAANTGRARLPAGNSSFDLLICRRGPFHWVEDAGRVARPGAVLLMLVPNATPSTAWSSSLPEPLGWSAPDDPLWARDRIADRLAIGGLSLDSYWTFVVPEVFDSPEELYRWRAWGYLAGECPSFDDVRPLFEQIFAAHRRTGGLAVLHSRFLWKAVVQ
ncbi:MAG: class I SAM-dependent methyltransferase [Dehalococcoidia bacterium]